MREKRKKPNQQLAINLVRAVSIDIYCGFQFWMTGKWVLSFTELLRFDSMCGPRLHATHVLFKVRLGHDQGNIHAQYMTIQPKSSHQTKTFHRTDKVYGPYSTAQTQ